MTRGNTTKKATQKRAPRKCSVCGKTGHNTRTCSSLAAKKTKPKKKQSSYVSVHVGGEVKESPHVVELKKNEQGKHWDRVEVYSDAPQIKHERHAVDFAKMVRHANLKDTEKKLEEKEKNISVDILSEIAKIQPVEIKKPGKKMSAFKVGRILKKKQGISFSKKIVNAKDSLERRKDSFYEGIQNIQEKFSIKRFAVSTIILFVIMALPFPVIGYYKKIQNDTARIVSESTNAFLSLQSSTVAAFQHNIPQAQYDLNVALNSFSTAEEIIDKEYKAIVYVAGMLPVVGSKVKSRQDLLLAGHHLALGNTYLVKGVSEATEAEDADLIDRMSLLRQHIKSALPQYEEALVYLSNVDESVVPVEYQQSFSDFKMLFGGFIGDMKQMDDVIQGIQLVMGGDGFKRYLVLFQNHHELRATGGFVGSFAVVDIQNGKVQNIEVPGGGSYDLQGQLNTFVKPPLPLQLLNERWEFQDGNWFPDFKTSAEKMAWFYRQSRNATVDGVIALNSTVLERLLSVVGPIENEDYELILESEDALSNLQYEIESYEDMEENTPKAVLSVLLDQLMERMTEVEPSQIVNLVTELHDALKEREIQFYFKEDVVQSVFSEYGWTGELRETNDHQDYLMVVNTNLGGGKSDAKMRQQIHHQAVIDEDGSVIDTVLITRFHEGDGSEQYFDEVNSSYVRLYVPEGSELLDAGGFVYPDEASFRVPPRWYEDDEDLLEIEKEKSIHIDTGTRVTDEFGKTAFANWIVTKPNRETQVYFTYKLPFNVFEEESVRISDTDGLDIASLIENFKGQESLSRYSMFMQRQSGSQSNFSHATIYPDSWKPVWKSGDDLFLSINGASIEGPFDYDRVFGILMKKE